MRSRHAQIVGETVKIYTAKEVAGLLKVDYKTVLRLIKRGLLKAIPGIRHKWIWGVVNPKNIPTGERKRIYCTGRQAT